MKIILTSKEVAQIRKACYKFNIEGMINETIDKMYQYDYAELKEDNNGMEINISSILMDKVTGLLSALAPKVVQIVGAVKAVLSLTGDLFSKESMKELDKFDLYLNPYNKIIDSDGKVTLEISEDGRIVELCEDKISKESINSVIERLSKDYDEHKDLQSTRVGENVVHTVYSLKKLIERMEAK